MLLKRIQLGMIHTAVAMTLVPINSTLNRVMIKELAISATTVAVLASLPYLFSPIQVAIGTFSDRHPVGGYRRTPYIIIGLFLCVLGVVMAPKAAYILPDNFWAGAALGLLIFGAWGMGFNFASVSYLSLATEMSEKQDRSKTIATMWFMMISGIIITAVALSRFIDPYTPAALEGAFWKIGLLALALGLLGLIKLEKRSFDQKTAFEGYSWMTILRSIFQNRQVSIFFLYLVILLSAILGQDILLEPYGGEAFALPVNQTTRITSIWGGCVLVALLLAGALERRVRRQLVAVWGALAAFVGFFLIGISGLVSFLSIFYVGLIALGIGTGLSTVSNLSLMLDMTIKKNVGLFIGAWGMANALSRLIGTLLGGVVRDIVTQISQDAVIGYVVVFALEASMLLVSLFLLRLIDVSAYKQRARKLTLVEKATMAGEI